VVFGKLEFDYCITDEASQILLTTCLGPLFVSRKFILVGDLEQLPPIIKSKEARLLGMGASLFEWLDTNDTSPEKAAGSVELVHQYRMNREIMDLANRMTYAGKLRCVSDLVASSRLQMSAQFMQRHAESGEFARKLFARSVVFLDTSELMRPILARQDDDHDADKTENRTVNRTESQLVRQLCQIFVRHSEASARLAEEHIGVIAPYNNQVKEIQAQLRGDGAQQQQIEVNTVDQFQGRDKKMIIMSFTNSVIKEEDTKVGSIFFFFFFFFVVWSLRWLFNKEFSGFVFQGV
jgi:DNA replication ATP-dependent helicase Dna2